MEKEKDAFKILTSFPTLLLFTTSFQLAGILSFSLCVTLNGGYLSGLGQACREDKMFFMLKSIYLVLHMSFSLLQLFTNVNRLLSL